MVDTNQQYVLRGADFSGNTELSNACLTSLGLRISGYQEVYKFTAMPVDIYDHFSNQLLLYKNIKNRLEPVACIRFVSLSACREHGIAFLPLVRVHDSKKPDTSLSKKLKNTIKNTTNTDIVYNSGLAVSFVLVSAREKQVVFKTIIGLALNYHKAENNTGFMASAAPMVKTDRTFEKIGFQPLCEESCYTLESFGGKKNIMLRHQVETSTYHEWLNNTETLWNRRRELAATIPMSHSDCKKIEVLNTI